MNSIVEIKDYDLNSCRHQKRQPPGKKATKNNRDMLGVLLIVQETQTIVSRKQ